MPSGAKKRKAIKRKMETANHHHHPNSGIASNNSQGNGAGDHDDSSDHPLTDDDFSPRASMHGEPDPEPKGATAEDTTAEGATAEGATAEGASLVPVEHRAVSESEPPEPVGEPEALVATVESHTPLEIGEKTGEGGSHSEGSGIPVSATATRDALAARPAPLLESRAVWWNCCGLMDLFGGSQR